MKIFIWEGNGISDAYHDDGTLVVLAETVDQARDLVLKKRAALDGQQARWNAERELAVKKSGLHYGQFWHTDEGKALMARQPAYESNVWDGKPESLDREPDRVVELDKPTWVAFNGGGYD